MATRKFRLSDTLTGSQSNKTVSGSPLAPPSGIKWTVVEVRPAFGSSGKLDLYFDTELYHTFSDTVTTQYSQPRVIALDIVQPHQLRVLATDESGSSNTIDVEITIEESPQSGS